MKSIRHFASAAVIAFAVAAGPAWADEEADEQISTTADDKVGPVAKPEKEEKKSGWQIKPRFRVQYDVADIDGPATLTGQGRSSEFRRSQLGVDITMPGGFSARVEGEFTADPIEFADAYIAWSGDGLTITAGQQKHFTPLDDMTSDLNTSFTERAALVTAFGYGRRTGLSANYIKGDFMVGGGVFTDPLILLDDVGKNSLSVDLRAAWMPTIGKAKVHLGAAYHWKDRNDFEANPLRYRQRPLAHSTETRYISTPGLTVDKEQSYGLEAGAVLGRFHAASEVHWLHASRPGFDDPTFFGAYGEVGFFLTNDSRPLKNGAFGAIKPKKPLGSGGIGAVQVNARYDILDLNSKGATGGKQDGYMASIIWTPIENLRLLANYARLDYTDAALPAGVDRDYSVDVFQVRGQITF